MTEFNSIVWLEKQSSKTVPELSQNSRNVLEQIFIFEHGKFFKKKRKPLWIAYGGQRGHAYQDVLYSNVFLIQLSYLNTCISYITLVDPSQRRPYYVKMKLFTRGTLYLIINILFDRYDIRIKIFLNLRSV